MRCERHRLNGDVQPFDSTLIDLLRAENERLRAENAKLREGLAWLAKAVGFLDKCNSDRIKAKETGAMVDAWEWLEEAAREACLGITPDDIAEGERQAKSGEWVKLDDLRDEDDGA